MELKVSRDRNNRIYGWGVNPQWNWKLPKIWILSSILWLKLILNGIERLSISLLSLLLTLLLILNGIERQHTLPDGIGYCRSFVNPQWNWKMRGVGWIHVQRPTFVNPQWNWKLHCTSLLLQQIPFSLILNGIESVKTVCWWRWKE